MDDILTIHQHLKQENLQEEARIKECTEAIKKIHANGPDMVVIQLPSSNRHISKGRGNIAKFSPGGKHIGWYREDQKSGLPNQSMPIEQDLKEHYRQYKKAVLAAYPQSATAAILGKKSGESRKEKGLSQQIINLYQQLTQADKPKHHRANLIAGELYCTAEYVRRVLRRNGITK